MLPDSTTASIPLSLCAFCGLPTDEVHLRVHECKERDDFVRRAAKKRNSKCENSSHDTDGKKEKWCEKCQPSVRITEDVNRVLINRRIKMLERAEVLPNSMETFLGRPHFLISFEPDKSCSEKIVIDSSGLLNQAIHVLMTPPIIDKRLSRMNSLQRLAYGLNYLRTSQKTEITTLFTLNRDSCMGFYQHFISVVAGWFSYCEEFTQLPLDMQVRILKCVWLVWIRLERTSMTAEMRGHRVMMHDKTLGNSFETVISLDEFDVDCEWFTNYSKQQMRQLMDFLETDLIINLLIPLIQVRPSDMELSFMLFQLCFHIAGKLLGSEITGITDKLIEKMAGHLHDYYVSDTNAYRYAQRLLMLLKINKDFEKYTMLRKEKVNIARVFDVFTVEFSDPELNNEIC